MDTELYPFIQQALSSTSCELCAVEAKMNKTQFLFLRISDSVRNLPLWMVMGWVPDLPLTEFVQGMAFLPAQHCPSQHV